MTHSDPSTASFADGLPTSGGLVLADPELADQPLPPDSLVLGVGYHSRAAPALLDAARDAAAVVLRRPAAATEAAGLAGQARGLGLALHWLPTELGWTELLRQLLPRLQPAGLRADDELAELAETIATLTGGLVTIEDTSARVLAYSRSSDEVDDLRRRSILGRSGPADYLALLRTWGVYDRLATSEDVVEIAEHPESGVRRRLAIGVFADNRQLGTIWLQQGAQPFGPNARSALVGAARLASAQLVGTRADRVRPSGLVELLSGETGQLPGLGRSAARSPCAVAVFDLPEGGAATAEDGTAEPDPAGRQVRLDAATSIVRVHAVAFRREAVAEQLDGRVYLLIPQLTADGPALAMLAETVDDIGRHTATVVRAALGSRADTVAVARSSRLHADLAGSLEQTERVVGFATVRPRLLTRLAEAAVAAEPGLWDGRLTELIRQAPLAGRTLLEYLECGTDVTRVAQRMDIHPTTVRYRLRKVLESADFDLSDPDVCMSLQLQLRCGLRDGASAR